VTIRSDHVFSLGKKAFPSGWPRCPATRCRLETGAPCAQQRTALVGWKSPPGQKALRPRTRTRLRRSERTGWRAGGGEPVARRRTNVIRPGVQTSWRIETKSPPGRGLSHLRGAAIPHGLPDKGRAADIGWLTTGRREGAVRGLGKSAVSSGGMATAAGGRGVVVLSKPVKAGGGKGARKLDRGVRRW
jgi:hypothetical protein